MRVLFTTWAWPSHYFPLVPLAWALRAAGHEVRMTSQPDLRATMRDSGLPFSTVGRDVDVAGAYRAARDWATTPPEDRPTPPPRPAGADRTARPAPDRGSDRAQWVCDRVAAEHLRADPDNPHLRHAHRVMRLLEEETRTIFAGLRQLRPQGSGPPLYGEVAETMTDDLLRLARSWRPDLIVYDPLTDAGPRVAELVGVPAIRNLFGPDVTYYANAGSPAGLGTATVDPCPPGLQISAAPGHRIGTSYVPYNGVGVVPPGLPERSATTRICLTWGTSIHRLFGEQAFLPEEVLLAVTKLARDRGAELVLAITSNQRHLLPDLPSTVRVVESVPLDALLPTCHALIHQGGAGTTLTALRHGLPQIILSQVFDQTINAFQLVAAGAGLTRAVTELTAAQLVADGHELLDEPSFRDAALRLRQEIRDQPAPAQAIAELLALAHA